MPVWPRALTIALVLNFVYGVYGLVVALVSADGLTDVFGGLLAGLRYALMFGLGLALVSVPRDSTTRIPSALIAGLVIGLGFGFAEGFADVPDDGLRDGLVLGTQETLSVWLVVSLGFILVTNRGARLPRQLARRGWWNRTDLRATLVAGLAAGLAVKFIWGLIVGSAAWLLNGRSPGLAYLLGAGLLPAFLFGFAAGVGRRPRQQPGRQPSDRPDTRTILTATIIGFAIALVSSYALGFTFLVLIGLGGRPPRQLRRRQWNRAGRRTTLMAGLGAALVAGSVVGLEVGSQKGSGLGPRLGSELDWCSGSCSPS